MKKVFDLLFLVQELKCCTLIFLFCFGTSVCAQSLSENKTEDPLLIKYFDLYNTGQSTKKQESTIIEICSKNKDRKERICKELIQIIQENLSEEKFEDIFSMTSLYKKIAEYDDPNFEKILFIEGNAFLRVGDIDGVNQIISEMCAANASPKLIDKLRRDALLAYNPFYGLDGCWVSINYYDVDNCVPYVIFNIENSIYKNGVKVSTPVDTEVFNWLKDGMTLSEVLSAEEIYANYCTKFTNDSIYICWATGDSDVGNAFVAGLATDAGWEISNATQELVAQGDKYELGDRLAGSIAAGLVETTINTVVDNMMSVKRTNVIVELRLARVNDRELKGRMRYRYIFLKDGALAKNEEFEKNVTLIKYLDKKVKYPVAYGDNMHKRVNECLFIKGHLTKKLAKKDNLPVLLRMKAMSDNALHKDGCRHSPDDCVLCNPDYLPYLGLTIEEITPENTKKSVLKITQGRGVRIKRIDDNYLGYMVDTVKANFFKTYFGTGQFVYLKEGDIVLEINGIPCDSPQDYVNVVRMHNPGDVAYIKILRKKRERIIKTRFIYAKKRE